MKHTWVIYIVEWNENTKLIKINWKSVVLILIESTWIALKRGMYESPGRWAPGTMIKPTSWNASIYIGEHIGEHIGDSHRMVGPWHDDQTHFLKSEKTYWWQSQIYSVKGLPSLPNN